MWKAKTTTEKQATAYTSSPLDKYDYLSTGATKELLSTSLLSDRFLYKFDFVENSLFQNNIYGSLSLSYRPLSISDDSNVVYPSKLLAQATGAATALSQNLYYLFNTLSTIDVLDTEHKNLDLTYEIVISNIQSYEDISFLTQIGGIERIELLNTALNYTSIIDLSLLASHSYNFNSSLTIRIKQPLYKIDGTACTIANYLVKPNKYLIKAVANSLSNRQVDFIELSHYGVFPRLNSFKDIDAQLPCFFSNSSYVYFIVRSF